jgi:hypothetical protein
MAIWPNILILSFLAVCLLYSRKASFYVWIVLPAIIWNACVNFGINVSASKVLSGVFIVTYGLAGYLQFKRRIVLFHIFDAVVLYSVVCLLIAAVLIRPGPELNELMHSVFQRFPIRGLVATVFWIMNMSYFVLGFLCFESRKHLTKCLNTFLATCYVVSILAVIQIGANYLFPPIERLLAFISLNTTRAITSTSIAGFTIYRPSLFCAEARYLGLAMVLASAIIILSRVVSLPGMNKWLISWDKLLLYLALMLASASTSAIAGFAGGLVVLWVCIRRRAIGLSLSYRFRKGQLAILIALFVICFAGVEYKTGYMSLRYDHYLTAMGIARNDELTVGGESGIASTAYFRAMADNPVQSIIGFGLGNIGFFAYKYLDDTSPDYLDATVLSSRFPLIDLLAGIGGLGLTCVIILWLRWLLYVKDFSIRMREPSLLFLYYLQVFLLIALLVLDTFSLIWLFFGIALALIRRIQLNNGVTLAL